MPNNKKNRIALGDIASFSLLLQDNESKIESEHRDKILQAQIYKQSQINKSVQSQMNKLTDKVKELDENKANRRGRKRKP